MARLRCGAEDAKCDDVIGLLHTDYANIGVVTLNRWGRWIFRKYGGR